MAIIDLIETCAELLASVGERHWSVMLSAYAESAQEPPSESETEEILSWYGGMGSFSDVLISAMNDHDVKPEQEDRLNARLAELQSAIYDAAMETRLSSR